MRKFNFAKIVSLIFVCAMLLGALAIVAFASEEEVKVEIVSQNAYYSDKYQLVFAVNAPDGATVSAADSEGNPIGVATNTVDPTPTIDGVVCKAYILKSGVAAQSIDEKITFTVEHNGVTATKEYSFLQYIYERMYVSDNRAKGTELAMFEALLAYANAADVQINKATAENSISNYKYVTVVDGTLDGANEAGMFLPDATPFANIVADDYDNTAYNVEWAVSIDGAEAVRYNNDTIKTLAVSGNMTVTRVLVKSECQHNWSDATCETLATCSKCGETTGELADHTWDDATCEAPKTCSVCGETEGEPADHTWGDWNETTAPTCTKAGEKTRTCTVCNNATETETIPATGAHADANNDSKCDGCGGVIVISYTLVTDANQLSAGDKIIIVAADSDVAMSTTQNNNNRGQAAVTKNKNENTVSFTTAVQIFTIEAGTVNGTFAFNTGSGYIYAASSSSNYLKTESTMSGNSSWKVTITDGVASIIAQGTYTRNVMQYNQSSSLFACYSSASQKAISIYEQTITVTCAHEELEDTTTVDPTCTEAGSTSGTCTACGEEVVIAIPANGHTEETIPAVDATCADTGLTAGVKCSVCGETLVEQETVPATGEHADESGDGLCDVCDTDMDTDEAKAEQVLAGITAPTDVTEAGNVTLDITNETGYDATIGWAITGGTNSISTINGNILTVVLGDSETTLELVVTVTVGGATVTETYTINVAKAKAALTTTLINVFGSNGAKSGDGNSISWTDGTITLTNKKGSTAIRTTDTDHYRVYQGSTVTISGGTITKVVITCTSSDYATVCQTSLKNAGYTATVSGSVVTLELGAGADSITFTSSAQWRLNKIEVTYK